MPRNNQNPALAIDMGERFLFAMVTNIPHARPVLVPNTLERSRMKKIRTMAKKDPSSLHEELSSINTYLEKRCHYVIEYCLSKGIHSVALGNRSIKNPYKIRYKSLRDNPFLNISLQLVNNLRFECSLARIEVRLVDESFTSQIDALALEEIEYAGNNRWRRKSRPGHLRGKMYLSSSGNVINRDINAAINIGRVVFGDSFAEAILDEQLWDRPLMAKFQEDTLRIPTQIWSCIPGEYAQMLYPSYEEDPELVSIPHSIN